MLSLNRLVISGRQATRCSPLRLRNIKTVHSEISKERGQKQYFAVLVTYSEVRGFYF